MVLMTEMELDRPLLTEWRPVIMYLYGESIRYDDICLELFCVYTHLVDLLRRRRRRRRLVVHVALPSSCWEMLIITGSFDDS